VDGKVISQVEQTKPGDGIQVRVSDGAFGAVVSEDKESNVKNSIS
jgi:exonuclease VII large subunit